MSRLLVHACTLSYSFAAHSLFEGLSLSIHEGELCALIGENGAGKTTLLQLLAGTLVPDGGELKRASKLSVGLLPQEIKLSSSDLSARAYLEEGHLAELEKEMDQCLDHPEALARWSALQEQYEALGGYRQLPLEKVLQGLKIDSCLLEKPMSILSSGERVRIALAKALLQNPSLLLLDEPTNHLDQEMLVWLEKTLQARTGATLIVSHDRAFLNRVCNRLIELTNGSLHYYGGNYDFYLNEKKQLTAKQLQAYQAQKEERAHLTQQIKAMTFATKKVTAPKDRNIMCYDHRGAKQQKAQRHKLNKLKDELSDIEGNLLSHPLPKGIQGLRFQEVDLPASCILELEEAHKAYGEKILFSNLSKRLYKGSRIIITGANGSGKTTLLNAIRGHILLDRGMIRRHPAIKFAFLAQDEALPMEKTPLEYFEERFQLSSEDIRRELHRAALDVGSLLTRPFSSMSTGQRKRLMLLSLVLERPNLLLLDEPTNHLDLPTLEAFEKALLEFSGIIIAVSHDKTFIQKLAAEEWQL